MQMVWWYVEAILTQYLIDGQSDRTAHVAYTSLGNKQKGEIMWLTASLKKVISSLKQREREQVLSLVF